MTAIFQSIQSERERQNVKHPVTPKQFTSHIRDHLYFQRAAEMVKRDNDSQENEGADEWFNIMLEELYETFSEPGDTVESLTRMRGEAIQGAALYVRLIETIDGMIASKK